MKLTTAFVAAAAAFSALLLPGSTIDQAEAAPPAAQSKPSPVKAPADSKTQQKTTPEPVLDNVINASLDELVKNPQEYVGKNVRVNAGFFAFSSLGLDYKPAFRSSKTHLSFLVLKPNTHIPLSELKIAMMIPKNDKDAESTLLTSLKDGDQIELIGKVFSAALDDPWLEVFKLKKIASAEPEKKASPDEKAEESGDKSEPKTERQD